MYWDKPRSQTYLVGDLEDMLRAIAVAGARPRTQRTTLREADYQEGFMAAVMAMATALGVGIYSGGADPGHRIVARRKG
jgi:hypothetical protein